jgi:hypothetical protein
MLGNNKPINKNTYYLSRIPKVTSLHPRIKDEYLQKVDSPYKRAFLESPRFSDQYKIKTIGYFDKDSADILRKGINTITKTDQLYDRFLDSVETTPESRRVYEEYNNNNRYFGGKKSTRKQTKKNKTTKNIRKTRKTRKTRKNRKRTLKMNF